MADRTYTIYINLNSLPNSNGAMAEQESGAIGGLDVNNTSEAGALKAAQNLVSFATVASTADKVITNAISQVNLRTGAMEYEQRLDTVYSAAKQIIGAGAALAIGAATGNLPAVAAGMVASSVSTILSIAQKEITLQMGQSLENISIEMQNVRAGTSGRRGPNQ